MDASTLRTFAVQLLAEALFYDEEYGALGNVSLIDTDAGKEVYIASFIPDEGIFVVEEATEWEDYEPTNEDDIDYVLAVDSRSYGSYENPGDTAEALLDLTEQKDLSPSITLVFELDEST